MNRLVSSLLASAVAAGVGYYLRNRRSLRTNDTTPTRERGVTIYDNHPVAG